MWERMPPGATRSGEQSALVGRRVLQELLIGMYVPESTALVDIGDHVCAGEHVQVQESKGLFWCSSGEETSLGDVYVPGSNFLAV
jgi:hypothetical protein